jgi:hypothetical protein
MGREKGHLSVGPHPLTANHCNANGSVTGLRTRIIARRTRQSCGAARVAWGGYSPPCYSVLLCLQCLSVECGSSLLRVSWCVLIASGPLGSSPLLIVVFLIFLCFLPVPLSFKCSTASRHKSVRFNTYTCQACFTATHRSVANCKLS